ncbi:MAG: hypothetical protein JST43_11620 [Bacteroidetes bacterium]|nr:hypothetical protein [Bacteroidota bacterium]MBS1540015.1 hypothetical protein [Bacteroidota bacterium]
MTTFLISIMLLLTGCTDDSTTKQKIGDRLLEDPEHHIKDNPNILKHDSTILYTGWYYVIDTPNSYKRQLYKSNESYYLDPKPIIIAKNFTVFEIYESNYDNKKYFGLTMRLDKEGTENWSYATQKAIMKKLAFVLDNELLQVATVKSQITGGVTVLNRGDYSRQELENFKTVIESER